MSDAFDREEEALCAALGRGEITAAEYHRQMRELQRDYRDMAEEAAENAYRNELENW